MKPLSITGYTHSLDAWCWLESAFNYLSLKWSPVKIQPAFWCHAEDFQFYRSAPRMKAVWDRPRLLTSRRGEKGGGTGAGWRRREGAFAKWSESYCRDMRCLRVAGSIHHITLYYSGAVYFRISSAGLSVQMKTCSFWTWCSNWYDIRSRRAVTHPTLLTPGGESKRSTRYLRHSELTVVRTEAVQLALSAGETSRWVKGACCPHIAWRPDTVSALSCCECPRSVSFNASSGAQSIHRCYVVTSLHHTLQNAFFNRHPWEKCSLARTPQPERALPGIPPCHVNYLLLVIVCLHKRNTEKSTQNRTIYQSRFKYVTKTLSC